MYREQCKEQCTSIANVMGSNPVQAQFFFQALFSLPLMFRTAMITLILIY